MRNQETSEEAANQRPLPTHTPDGMPIRIGELAALAGATTRTLRYYEEMGLLQPVRNTNGQRFYDSSALARLSFIAELKSGGFSLQEIKTFFDSWQRNKTGAEAAAASMNLIQQKVAEISALQEKLAKVHRELRTMVNFLSSCQSCHDKPSAHNCGDCGHHPDQPPNPLIMRLVNPE